MYSPKERTDKQAIRPQHDKCRDEARGAVGTRRGRFPVHKGHWEDFPEEIKAALGPEFVKELDEIIEKGTKL